ncbi:MAG: DUF4382 domain-containing protein [Cyanobacteria bacterium J06560_2]
MRWAALGLLTIPLLSCSQATPSNTATATDAPGTLKVVANGEDFVRQGFTDKDGWNIAFDHVYVTLGDITASQSEPPFEPGKGETLKAVEQVQVSSSVTVDLAAGEADAPPILVSEITEAPSGRYNALSWEMVSPASGPSAGYPLVMIGTATKDDEQVSFQIQMTEELAFNCGDFVGDARKGILASDDTAEIEATFHFDHIFGDGETATDDDINTGALGFDALAAIAQNNELNVTSEDLEKQLSPEDYTTLKDVLLSLGHVGEGHCEATLLTR